MGFIGFWEKSIASKTADGSAFSQGSLGPKKVAPTDPKTPVVFSPINQWVPSYEGHLWTSVRRGGKAHLCWVDELLRINCFSQICIEKGIRYSESKKKGNMSEAMRWPKKTYFVHRRSWWFSPAMLLFPYNLRLDQNTTRPQLSLCISLSFIPPILKTVLKIFHKVSQIYTSHSIYPYLNGSNILSQEWSA